MQPRFRNHYLCPDCGHSWTDDWDSTCDDDCPNCGTRHISPHKSDDLPGAETRVQQLNDAFRRTFVGGAVVLTRGVYALPKDTRAVLLAKVRTFADFDEDDEDHELVALEHDGERYLAKIDCYDRNLEHGSPDPANPDLTTRVLTVMLAEEY